MNLDLSHRPLVVATVTQPDDLAHLSSQTYAVSDLLEYRLDNLVEQVGEVLNLLPTSASPSLVTVRRAEEGGANNLPDDQRFALYEKARPHADLLDIEVASLHAAPFQDLAKDAAVVGSFHDFESFPGDQKIREVVDHAYELGARIAKVAVVVETMDDLFSLAQIVESHHTQGRLISAMGMGPLGRLSRLVLAQSGSCLNYGYLRIANAPGQWSAKELSDLIGKLTQ